MKKPLENTVQVEVKNRQNLRSWLKTNHTQSVKRGILKWIKNAKRSETRGKRIQQTVSKAAINIRANY